MRVQRPRTMKRSFFILSVMSLPSPRRLLISISSLALYQPLCAAPTRCQAARSLLAPASPALGAPFSLAAPALAAATAALTPPVLTPLTDALAMARFASESPEAIGSLLDGSRSKRDLSLRPSDNPGSVSSGRLIPALRTAGDFLMRRSRWDPIDKAYYAGSWRQVRAIMQRVKSVRQSGSFFDSFHLYVGTLTRPLVVYRRDAGPLPNAISSPVKDLYDLQPGHWDQHIRHGPYVGLSFFHASDDAAALKLLGDGSGMGGIAWGRPAGSGRLLHKVRIKAGTVIALRPRNGEQEVVVRRNQDFEALSRQELPPSFIQWLYQRGEPRPAVYLIREDRQNHIVQTIVRLPRRSELPPRLRDDPGTIEVIQGEMTLILGGRERIVSAGKPVPIPAGTAFSLRTDRYGAVEFLANFKKPFYLYPPEHAGSSPNSVDRTLDLDPAIGPLQ